MHRAILWFILDLILACTVNLVFDLAKIKYIVRDTYIYKRNKKRFFIEWYQLELIIEIYLKAER